MATVRKIQPAAPPAPAGATSPATTPDRVQKEIAARAYQIWEASGRPNGRDREHWLRAEQELLQAAARRTR